MHVFRITHARWAESLAASGFAARWNPKGRFVIYTGGSRALACLENVVHRSGEGLNNVFKVMVIQIPDDLNIAVISLNDLPENWFEYSNYHLTQQVGVDWIDARKAAVLKVPSVIVPQEHNFLINPQHPDFSKIKLLGNEDFVFDPRIKRAMEG